MPPTDSTQELFMRKALFLSAAVIVGLSAGALWNATAEAG
jgi:hypothetical protein